MNTKLYRYSIGLNKEGTKTEQLLLYYCTAALRWYARAPGWGGAGVLPMTAVSDALSMWFTAGRPAASMTLISPGFVDATPEEVAALEAEYGIERIIREALERRTEGEV